LLLAHHDTFHVDLTQLEGVPPDYTWRYEREANEFASALFDATEDAAATTARSSRGDDVKVARQSVPR